jgi:hypothetical protein
MMARATGRRGKRVRGWHGSVKLLKEEKEGQKAHRGGGGISTESSPEAAMAVGLALGCARWERRRGRGGPRGSSLAHGQVKEEEGGYGRRGALTSGGPDRQRRGCDEGGR